jgi:4-amino-4-deoxy-L-arabinose transferase-like glycosyltransferase
MLSLKNKRVNYSFFNTTFVIIVLISVTLVRIYSLIVSPIELSVDEAQYWDWSRNLDFGYFTKPPLIAWTIALTTTIFGNEEWAVRLSSPIFHFLTSIVLWKCGQLAFGFNAGRIAALIWIFTPAASLGSFIISTDTPLILFWSLSLLFLFQLLNNTSYNLALGIGISIGLAFLSKYAALYFIIFFILWWMVYDRGFGLDIKKIFIIILTSLVISAGNIYWNYLNDFVTVNHTVSNADLSEIRFNYSNVIDFLSSQLLVFGPIIFLIFIFIVFDGFTKNKKIALLAMLSLPIVLLITIQSFLKIANPNWAVTSYVAASLLISAYLTLNRSKFLRLAFNTGLIVNLIISVYILKVTMAGSFSPVSLKSDPLRKNLGFEMLANNLDKIIDKKNISKVVFERRGDITRFNYYLNRNNNKHKNKVFINTDSVIPGNFYEANNNYKYSQNSPGDKILIVRNSPNLEDHPFENLHDIKFVKSISSNTVKNLKRTYYLYESTYR